MKQWDQLPSDTQGNEPYVVMPMSEYQNYLSMPIEIIQTTEGAINIPALLIGFWHSLLQQTQSVAAAISADDEVLIEERIDAKPIATYQVRLSLQGYSRGKPSSLIIDDPEIEL